MVRIAKRKSEISPSPNVVDLGRLYVKQEAGNHRLRAAEIAPRHADAEDRAPEARLLEPPPEPDGKGCLHTTRYLSASTIWPLSTSSRSSLLMVTRYQVMARGAGPLVTLPWLSKVLPWQGQWKPSPA